MKIINNWWFAPNERVRIQFSKLTHFCLCFVCIILNLIVWLFSFFFSSIFSHSLFILSETEINDHCITFLCLFICPSINLMFVSFRWSNFSHNSKINQLTNHLIGKTELFKRAKSYNHWIIFLSLFINFFDMSEIFWTKK